jgi:hypothetical protein
MQIVFPQSGQHVLRCDEIGVVVGRALQFSEMAGRAGGGAADLAGALSDIIRRCGDIGRVVIERQVIVAETGPVADETRRVPAYEGRLNLNNPVGAYR